MQGLKVPAPCPLGCSCPKCASKAAVGSDTPSAGGSGGRCADKSAKSDNAPDSDGGSVEDAFKLHILIHSTGSRKVQSML